jgi:hypothetical protein
MKARLDEGFRRARRMLPELGPYLALLLLPGGSLIALAAWAYRHWSGAERA